MKIHINAKIILSLGLSENEMKVFGALLDQPLAKNVSRIGKRASLPRVTTLGILRRLEKRKLAEQVLSGKRYHWKFKRGLEFMKRGPRI
jgi:sugar-specific transcriptional regulator TrmB